MNNTQSSDQPANATPGVTKPNDSTGIYYSTVIKITDPKTGQVLLHTRGE